MKMRALLVAPAALLAGFYVLRVALVGAFAASAPGRAAAIWPGHPVVILQSGLAEVGRTAMAGANPDPALVNQLLEAYRKAPLAPEPYLVRGVQAQSAGDDALSGRAFVAARNSAPRHVAARYFLADHYLRTGQTEAGLKEISALARLVPQGVTNVAPYLAAFARTPGGARHVRTAIHRQPQLEGALLNVLAADPANHDLILGLWSGRGGAEARIWQARLLDALVEARQYDRARAAWLRFTGADANKDDLPGSGFEPGGMPPFGWSFASGPAGVAEPEADGGLHILYYGRDQLVLASKLITLAPGRYRMSLKVSRGAPGADALSWAVVCQPASTPLASGDLSNVGKGGAIGASFAVPLNCPAQRIELVGTPPQSPQQVDVTVSELLLLREGKE